jgi:hypothetical protein
MKLTMPETAISLLSATRVVLTVVVTDVLVSTVTETNVVVPAQTALTTATLKSLYQSLVPWV